MTASQLAVPKTRNLQTHGGARAGAGRKTDEERASDVYADYNAARAKREMHNAKIAEYEERRIAGELVEKAKQTQVMQQIVANAKAKFISMPAKTAPMLVGLDSIAEVEEILRAAIYEALSELGRDA
jgi:hypothetical protein